MPYLRAAHVQPSGQLTLVDIKTMPFTLEESARLGLRRGDVVVVEGGAGFGRSAVLRDDLNAWGFQNSINRVRPIGDNGDGRFVNYVLLAAQASGHFQTLINTATIPHLTAEKLADVQVAWPCVWMQNQIADYLDTQTAKIDLLIERQQRLIETLAERRQAVVSHAVANGLDPIGRTKNSGVAWLKNVPESWSVSSLKRVIAAQTSGTSVNGTTSPAGMNEIGVLKTSSVSSGVFLPEENKTVVTEDLERVTCPLVAGSILVNRANSPDKVGAAVVVRASHSNLYLSDKLWQLRLVGVDVIWLSWWLQTATYRDQVRALRVGTSSSMQNLSYEDFREIRIAIPPMDVQRATARHLDRETAQMDALSAKAREMIEVLKERRQALISAAVTGKIDVRGLS